jgi:cell division transport system permease protein
MTYGLLGSIIAWQLVDLFLLWLQNPTAHLASLYHSQFQLMGINLRDTLILLSGSILLGWLGSWFAVTRFLHSHRN